MRGVACAAILVLALTSAATAEDRAADLLADGNRLYEQGDYSGAASAYQHILDYGLRNEVVYYNLGNALFKLDRLGEAILAYERALRLDPGDREAAENLAYATSLTVDRAEREEPSFPVRAFLRLVNVTTVVEDAWLLLVAAYLLGGVGAAAILVRSRLARRALAYIGVVLLAMTLWSGGALVYKDARIHGSRKGVVLAEKVDVLSGPSGENTSLFTVHEGLQVEIRNWREGWIQILLPNGLNGWVPASALGVV